MDNEKELRIVLEQCDKNIREFIKTDDMAKAIRYRCDNDAKFAQFMADMATAIFTERLLNDSKES